MPSAAPKNSDRIITLNCGLGRDSLTLVALAAAGELEVEGLGRLSLRDIDAVLFSDTGCEWPHTYGLIDQVRDLVEAKATAEAHGTKFVILEKAAEGVPVVQEHATPEGWRDIERKAAVGGYHRRAAILDDFEGRATVASLGKGDCTCNHKILPIRRFLNDLSQVRFGLNNRQYGKAVRDGERAPHITIIGIAADETSRLENGGNGPSYVTEAYPLVTMGIAKADEAPILKAVGLDFVRKSGCYMCPYQPASWWWALSVTEPELFARAVRYEEIALARNPRMGATGVRRGGEQVRLPQLAQEWRERNPDATLDAVLNKEYSRCTKDARAAQKAEMSQEAPAKRRVQLPLFAA